MFKFMAIGPGFVSWGFAKDACKHGVFKISDFSLIFKAVLMFSALKLLHLFHDFILVLTHACPSL